MNDQNPQASYRRFIAIAALLAGSLVSALGLIASYGDFAVDLVSRPQSPMCLPALEDFCPGHKHQRPAGATRKLVYL